jgi:hypothetical protein
MHRAWFIWLLLASVAAPVGNTAGAAQTILHEAFYKVTLANGILPAFLVDYGNLVAPGELKSIRRLAGPEC